MEIGGLSHDTTQYGNLVYWWLLQGPSLDIEEPGNEGPALSLRAFTHGLHQGGNHVCQNGQQENFPQWFSRTVFFR